MTAPPIGRGDAASRRATLLAEKEKAEKRKKYGPNLVRILSKALQKPYFLASFLREEPPYSLSWPKRIEEAPGLVAPYISRAKAMELLGCIGEMLGEKISGRLGFHDKDYLGLLPIDLVAWNNLLDLAELANESLVLYPELAPSVILIDCYPHPRLKKQISFSIVVQGQELESRVSTCFKGEWISRQS